jgi:uncharacterized membrane protein YeaQ/YmgE (transglycosylase-associated protein family)
MVMIIWATLGALLGWFANTAMRTDDRQRPVLSITIGVIAAVLGGMLVDGPANAWAMSFGSLSLGGTVAAASSASILLLVARFARVTG